MITAEKCVNDKFTEITIMYTVLYIPSRPLSPERPDLPGSPRCPFGPAAAAWPGSPF